MDLFMLRHGIATGRSVSSTAHDADRPLTKKGAKRARIIAERLRDLDISFDVVLASPFQRAKETANIVVGVFKYKDRLNISPHLKVGGSKIALIKEINARFGNAGSILLVGHEPYLTDLISVLLSGTNGLAIRLKKGGICKLTVESLSLARCATLDWLITPRQLLRGG